MRSCTTIFISLILLTVSINQAFSQIEEVELNPEGIVFPRYNTADRDNLSPVIGQCIYNTDHSFVECFDGIGLDSQL